MKTRKKTSSTAPRILSDDALAKIEGGYSEYFVAQQLGTTPDKPFTWMGEIIHWSQNK